MYRKQLNDNHGMVFVYAKEDHQVFWMKNTYIPLDILFLDEHLKVVGILEDVPVMNEEPRDPGVNSQYVIELNAGTAKRLGLKLGDQYDLRPMPKALN